MKAAVLCFAGSLLFLFGSIAVRFIHPADALSNDPEIRALEERNRALTGFETAITDMEARAEKARAALWTQRGVDGFINELPKGWQARSISADTHDGITLHRYAFSKDAVVRDFPEILRVLKKLEEHPSTRVDIVNLTVNGDGKRFSTALITATIPTS